MKSTHDLAAMVREHEAQLAPGSETALLGAFVAEFGHVADLEEADPEPVSDETYRVWANAYAEMARREEAGEEYELSDLF